MLISKVTANYLNPNHKDIVFVCFGTKSSLALEDALAAGYIIQKMLSLNNIVHNKKKFNINLKKYNLFPNQICHKQNYTAITQHRYAVM